jgi:hypothetical protein
VTRVYLIRRKSVKGEPKPDTTIERTCQECGASFVGLAAGTTGLRGPWDEWRWFCSIECYAVRHTADQVALLRGQVESEERA